MDSTDAPSHGPLSTKTDPSTGAPDLWFELPPGFVQFDLDEDSEVRLLRMADAADSLFTGATPEQKFSLVASGEYILRTLIEAGAEHVSSCLLRSDGDKLSQGTFSVIIERPETGPQSQDRQGSAKRTAVQWRSLYPDAEVGLVMLPYGIAALCVRDQELQIPGVIFGLDEPISATVRQVQFCVPLQTGPGSALFVFMTEDIDKWPEYLDLLSGIMASVSPDDPGEPDEATNERAEGPGGGRTETHA
ncbi:hypothetical protein KVH07_07020 [Streptomyces olivaceus]|uniref:hypothetical protein n=1 Tax=Streptomyces TaxID=1883 RepID=UPI001413B7C7|nr:MULTISPECIES: hypothetical protein [Streptomyces]MBZ6192683.1 hypothetical protein [Streptomyces olivaceus]MBZ6289398.1 hypothetical protein [Streptomyces olivaceus]MBZ6326417.1 hypothetical protein [Streptomyces olivaceus]MCC2265231.1 hypothetical protein [Streptomyces sp. CT1-17]QIP72401.1 hypothetical protein EZV63_23290 [Streptomyces sp. VN1]